MKISLAVAALLGYTNAISMESQANLEVDLNVEENIELPDYLHESIDTQVSE